LRPTWHFVSPDDIFWMVELSQAKVKKMMGTYSKALGLDEEVFDISEKVITKALANHNYLTRAEVGALLKKNGVTWHGNGLAHIVMSVELSGVICSGPRKGIHQTYALLSDRALNAVSKTRNEGIKELTKRYFYSHGPAQITDFNWWSGLSVQEIRAGIEMNPKLSRTDVEGKTYYFFETGKNVSSAKIYLLPNYDEYTVAYKDRDALDFRQSSLFNNVIIIEGKIAGVWRRTLRSKDVIVEIRLFKTLSRSEKQELDDLKMAARKNFPEVRIQTRFNHFKENIRRDLKVRSEVTYKVFMRRIEEVLTEKLNDEAMNKKLFALLRDYSYDPIAVSVLTNIQRYRGELTAYRGIPQSSVTSNIIEGLNSHLEARLVSLRSFQSPSHAKLWLNGYVMKRRYTIYTDCKEKFRHLNGKRGVDLTKKPEVVLPTFF
jgi:hypothetical protein